MTLGELLEFAEQQPNYLIFYFAIIPFAAMLAGILDGNRGHDLPWNYIYSLLIYLVSIPGLFALILNIYLFLFEQRSIMEMKLLIQVLPVISMLLTLGIIRRNVDLAYVPGFDKLSGFLILIFVVLIILWVVDRTRLFAVTRIRMEYLLLGFIVLLFLLRYGLRLVFGNPYRSRG